MGRFIICVVDFFGRCRVAIILIPLDPNFLRRYSERSFCSAAEFIIAFLAAERTSYLCNIIAYLDACAFRGEGYLVIIKHSLHVRVVNLWNRTLLTAIEYVLDAAACRSRVVLVLVPNEIHCQRCDARFCSLLASTLVESVVAHNFRLACELCISIIEIYSLGSVSYVRSTERSCHSFNA